MRGADKERAVSIETQEIGIWEFREDEEEPL
jgi:hypothetical protein